MKSTLFFMCILMFSLNSNAQVCNFTTEPSNTISQFNWMSPTFQIYLKNPCGGFGSSNIVDAPFFDLYGINVQKFSSGPAFRDFKPEDGWEVVFQGLGRASTQSESVDNPVLMLYNKNIATLRVFMQIFVSNVSYNKSSLVLRFANINPPGRTAYPEAAIFGATEDVIQPLQGFTKKIVLDNLNNFNDNCGNWLWQDVPLLYDPCVCLFGAQLRVSANLTSVSNITLNGTTYNGPAPTGNSAKSYTAMQKLNESNVLLGIKESGTGLLDAAKKVRDLEKSQTNFETVVSVITTAAQLGSVLIPGLGKVASGIKFLVSDGKTSSAASFTSTKLDGQIALNQTTQGSRLLIPGADRTGLDDRLFSIYNTALGNFNLVQLPVLHMYRYGPPSPKMRFYREPGNFNPDPYKDFALPDLCEFKLEQSSLQLLVNSALDISIKDFKVSIEYKPVDLANYQTGYYNTNGKYDVDPNPLFRHTNLFGPAEYVRFSNNTFNFPDYGDISGRYNYSDMRLAFQPDARLLSEAVFATEVVNPDCVGQTIFRIYNAGNVDWDKKLSLKVVLQYTVGDSPKVFHQMLSFKVKVEDHGNPSGAHYKLAAQNALNPLDIIKYESKTQDILSIGREVGRYSIYLYPPEYWAGNLESFSSGGYNVPRTSFISHSYFSYGAYAPYTDGPLTTYDVYAKDLITIRGMTSSTSDISISSNLIDVKPPPFTLGNPFQVTTIEPGITLVGGFLDDQVYGCGSSSTQLLGNQLTNFCDNESKYNPWVSNRKSFDSDSISILSLATLTLHPNPAPAGTSVDICFEKPPEEEPKVRMIDALGKQILCKQAMQGSCLRLVPGAQAKGLYILQISAGKQSTYKRLVIE